VTELAVGTEVTPSIRLKRPLGAGGMGSVWVADHAALRTEVVVKFLADRLAEDPTSQARFAREASAAAQVKSPHVVQMLDHGVMDGGHPFIVMELLDGRDLAQELRRRVLAPHEVAHVVEHIALALGRAHSRGIVHRDIKPNNIFLCDVGTSSPFVKLLDFGIAREGDQNLTTTGHLVGTPAYMSPEQLSGRPVEAQSDLWSLAVVALKALTGKNPYERPTMPETIGAVVHGDIPVPSALCAGLPAGVDAWFARACARDPTRRFGSSNALAEALWEAIGMPKTVVSSPSASGAPLPVPVPAASTVSITPSEPITEGTLRSVGGRVPPSLTPEPVAAQASRAPIALVGIAALALVAGLSFALGSVTTPAVPRLASTLRPIAARAAEFASKARREPPPSEGVSPVAPSATEKPSPKKPVAGKPKPKDDDDLGF
jgi:serine/threonine-protein kinase